MEWFDYWMSRCEERSVDVPSAFRGLAGVGRLGIPRKTYPTGPAVRLLAGVPVAKRERAIRRMIDVLLRAGLEDEGDRCARSELPTVLALALEHSPALFLELFDLAVGRHGLGEPFGDLPAEVINRLLSRHSILLSEADLVTAWYWICSCPGSFGRDCDGPAKITKILSQKRGESDPLVVEINKWLIALSPPKAESTSADEEDSTSSGKHVVPSSRPIDDVTPHWFSSWIAEDDHRTLREYLAGQGGGGWKKVCGLLASKISESEGARFDYFVMASGITTLGLPIDPDRAFAVALEHVEEKVRFQSVGESGGDASTPCAIGSAGLAPVITTLMARGLDISDCETISRTIRSIVALGRTPYQTPDVEAELAARVDDGDVRSVLFALLILRERASLSLSAQDRINKLRSHPDAWCRWIASTTLGKSVSWEPVREVTSATGFIAADPLPDKVELGASYFSGDANIREILLGRLDALVTLPKEELRRWLEAERLSLAPRKSRDSGWHRPRGHLLSDSRMSEAAGRLACRLGSEAPAEAIHALMSAVAVVDPWVATCSVLEPAVEGWVEFCRAADEVTPDGRRLQWSALALVPVPLLSLGSDERLARAVFHRFTPSVPVEFAWVSEAWRAMQAPLFEADGPIPLAFHNRPFTHLGRDRFLFVPQWSLPPFRNLTYCARPTPQWQSQDGLPVVVASYSEQNVGGLEIDHPAVSWSTGWYAEPSWLRQFSRRGWRIVRVTGTLSSNRTSGRQEGEKQEFSMVVVDP